MIEDAVLGIELGSTRIKAVLINKEYKPIASGDHAWENQYENGIWTYSMESVWTGLRHAYANLKKDVKERYGEEPVSVGALGVSAMMHGYLAFGKDGRLLAPFRTWRNTTTGEAAEKLTKQFGFNIPQRWSIAHLYQAILNGEEHVKDIAFLTTLAGYVHWKLTGEKYVGLGEASGMFPINSEALSYDADMLDKFDALVADRGYPWKIRDILPDLRKAGECGGTLTAEGAKLLDPSEALRPGIPAAPPEGDAGTGMVATNSVRVRTGNVSAGTSIFSMVVLERPLSKVHPEIDVVATPTGRPVAMVHCNTCTTDFDAWVNLFAEFAAAAGIETKKAALYDLLYSKSLEGHPDCGGLVSFNCHAGEPVAGIGKGCPLFARRPEARLTLADFLRSLLYSTMAALKIGMDVLAEEHVVIDRLTGHGGLFKTPVVGQRYLAAAVNAPVTCMETAGEGGPYGMALLAAYMLRREDGESLEHWLEDKVFAGVRGFTLEPETADVMGFNVYLKRYRTCLAAENAAAESV